MLGLLSMSLGGLTRRFFWLILFLFSRPGGWAVALALIVFLLKFGPEGLIAMVLGAQ